MKSIRFAGAVALAITAGIASASAADLPRAYPMPAKAPAYITPAYYWTGFYVGVNGGGGWGTSDYSAPLASGNFNTSGGLVGGTLGYNWQAGQMVLGLEGDIDWSNLRGDTTCGGVACETRNSWLSTARGRLGYAAGRFMPYVTGGAAFGDIKTSAAGIGSAHETKAGWTIGGGLEAAIAGPWTAKIEYLYVDLGSGAPITGAESSFKTNLVRAGLNYRF